MISLRQGQEVAVLRAGAVSLVETRSARFSFQALGKSEVALMTLSLEIVAGDRRRSVRSAVSRVVTVEPSPNVPGHEALVTNMSRDGARLFVRDIELPDRFAIIFADTRERRECNVVWRIGPEVGIEFVDAPPVRRSRKSAPRAVRSR